jgi:hypothetical protein
MASGKIDNSMSIKDVTGYTVKSAWSHTIAVNRTGRIIDINIIYECGADPLTALSQIISGLPKPTSEKFFLCGLWNSSGLLQAQPDVLTLTTDGNLVTQLSVPFRSVIRGCMSYITAD